MKHLEIFEKYGTGSKLLVILVTEETNGKEMLKNVNLSVGKNWYECLDPLLYEFSEIHSFDPPQNISSINDVDDVENYVEKCFRNKGMSDSLVSVKCIEVSEVSSESGAISFSIDDNMQMDTEEDFRSYLKKNFRNHYYQILKQLQSNLI
jgi:hypothetical protein